MGLVYDGHDATLDRRVAIKTILTRNLDEATAKHYEMRFRREVRAMAGTPSYMSPEQIQGQSIDRRTDIFSAGILFYQLLTGQKPFDGTGFALAKKIVQDDPVWPTKLVQIPPVIDAVVQRALAKAPEERYQTARGFGGDLKLILEGKPPKEAAKPAKSATQSKAGAE